MLLKTPLRAVIAFCKPPRCASAVTTEKHCTHHPYGAATHSTSLCDALKLELCEASLCSISSMPRFVISENTEGGLQEHRPMQTRHIRQTLDAHGQTFSLKAEKELVRPMRASVATLTARCTSTALWGTSDETRKGYPNGLWVGKGEGRLMTWARWAQMSRCRGAPPPRAARLQRLIAASCSDRQHHHHRQPPPAAPAAALIALGA